MLMMTAANDHGDDGDEDDGEDHCEGDDEWRITPVKYHTKQTQAFAGWLQGWNLSDKRQNQIQWKIGTAHLITKSPRCLRSLQPIFHPCQPDIAKH